VREEESLRPGDLERRAGGAVGGDEGLLSPCCFSQLAAAAHAESVAGCKSRGIDLLLTKIE
jgi:hypothetical protein